MFCASLGDVLDDHASIDPQWRADLWALIEATPHLDWLLLTKRIGNAARLLPPAWLSGHWPSHVWFGITATSQGELDRNLPQLRRLPTPVPFVSIEPMLGPVQLVLSEQVLRSFGSGARGAGPHAGLRWVIAGGETGPRARPLHPAWVRSLRDQCEAHGVPFFFKQWGEWGIPAVGRHTHMLRGSDGHLFPEPRPGTACGDDWVGLARLGRHRTGRRLDHRTCDGIPGAGAPTAGAHAATSR